MRTGAAFLALMLVAGQTPAAFAQQSTAPVPAPDATPDAIPGAATDAATRSAAQAAGPAALGQPSDFAPIMTVDPDLLFTGSRWGQRIKAEFERRGQDIADENERLANQFAAEEQQLTTLRATMAAEEFRTRADEFDKRVVEIRRQRDTIAHDLQTDIDTQRAAFLRSTLPILAKLMQERGAIAVLDQKAVFVSAQSVDVTQALIQRLDAEVGDGPALITGQGGPAGQSTDGQVTPGQTTPGQPTDAAPKPAPVPTMTPAPAPSATPSPAPAPAP